MSSMKGFQNINDSEQLSQVTNEAPQEESFAHKPSSTLNINVIHQSTEEELLMPSSFDTSVTSPSLRFRQQTSTASNYSTIVYDLALLSEIRKKGMRSEKLDKGCKKMYKSDVENLQLALKILGMGSAVTSAKSDIESQMSSSAVGESLASTNFASGHYDQNTRKQVRRFKKQEGLSVDPVVDHETFDKVFGKCQNSLRKPCDNGSGQLKRFFFAW